MNKKKPIILAAVILMAVVTAISASTFAWFTAQDTVVNKIETAKLTDGDVTIIETFDPEDSLMPGVDINKDVGAINTGDAPALVRISFSESLLKLLPKNPGEYQVRTADCFLDEKTADAAWALRHVPEEVDISKFEKDPTWIVYNPAGPDSQFPWYVAGQDSAFIAPGSKTTLQNLSGGPTVSITKTYVAPITNNFASIDIGNIIFMYKQTSVDPAPKKVAWSAFAPLGTTPQTYQRVEIRPEFFNLIRVPNPAFPADRTKDWFKLKVTAADPAADVSATPPGNPATAL